MNGVNKMIKFNLCLMISIVIISGCQNRNDLTNTTIKYKFVIKEMENIASHIDDNDTIQFYETGAFDFKTLSSKNINNCILHNKVFIDPFIDGEYQVTLKNWKRPGEDFTPYEMTLRGIPLKYNKDHNDNIIVCFAGPNGKVDSVLNNDMIISFEKKIYRPNIVYNSNVIEYDPTNGIYSNGDIIFVLTESTNTRQKYLLILSNDFIFINSKTRISNWNDLLIGRSKGNKGLYY